MDFSLVNPETTASKYASPEALTLVGNSGRFLPYITLYSSSSNAVKQRKIPQGNYGLARSGQIVDLGEEFDAGVLSWRPKAIQMPQGENSFQAYYDPKSADFKRCVTEADKGGMTGFMYGPEFLLWLPKEDTFATFLCGNVTARNEADNIVQMVGKPVTFKVNLIQKPKYSWYGPIVIPCRTPFERSVDREVLLAELEKFRNPPESDTETVQDQPAGEERAR